jgi:hypothetical protein
MEVTQFKGLRRLLLFSLFDLVFIADSEAAYQVFVLLANGDSRFRSSADPLLGLLCGTAWQTASQSTDG